jgi:hypothetical protein
LKPDSSRMRQPEEASRITELTVEAKKPCG